MSKWDKLMARLNRLSPDLQFEELRKILLTIGFEERRPGTGGSHYTYTKGPNIVTLPKHQTMAVTYIRKVRDAVNAEQED